MTSSIHSSRPAEPVQTSTFTTAPVPSTLFSSISSEPAAAPATRQPAQAPLNAATHNLSKLAQISSQVTKEGLGVAVALASGILGALAADNNNGGLAAGGLIGGAAGYIVRQLLAAALTTNNHPASVKDGIINAKPQDVAVYTSLLGSAIGGLANSNDRTSGIAAGGVFGAAVGAAVQKGVNHFLGKLPDTQNTQPQPQSPQASTISTSSDAV